MKKLLFTIMALSSFIWAELEEKSDEFKDMVSVDSEQIKSSPEDVIEEIEKVEKEEGLEDLEKYISQGKYYEALDKVIKLQKKCLDSLENIKTEENFKGFEYAVGNVMTQSYLIKIITDYALTTRYWRENFNINTKSVNEFMDLVKKHPNFLKKLYQSQLNLKYFQRIIITLIESIRFQKIDPAKYEKLDQLTDDEKVDFFIQQDHDVARSIEYYKMTFANQKFNELMNKIRQGVNQLINY